MANDSSVVPLVTSTLNSEEDDELHSPIFSNGSDDIQEFWAESKKLGYLAAPAIFTSICQHFIGAVTQVFAGHVGTIQLAAVSVENSVIAGFAFGIMVSYYFKKAIYQFYSTKKMTF